MSQFEQAPVYPMTHNDVQDLIAAIQPTNVCVDLPVSIPVSGWAAEPPYTYTYLNNKITSECGVTVEFESGAADTDCLALSYEKVAGGVQFTVDTVPTDPVPVIIHVLNAEAESITSVSADMVSTDAISGASNVQQALGTLNSNIATFSDANGSGAPTSFVAQANVATKTVHIRGACSGLTLNGGYTIFSNVISSSYVPRGDTAISAFSASFLVNAYISRSGSLVVYTPSAQSNESVTFGGSYLID